MNQRKNKDKQFLEWLFEQIFEGCPDGGDIQDKAEELGLLIKVEIPKDKIEEYSHIDFIDLDNPILFFPYWTKEAKQALKDLKEKGGGA